MRLEWDPLDERILCAQHLRLIVQYHRQLVLAPRMPPDPMDPDWRGAPLARFRTTYISYAFEAALAARRKQD